MKGFINLTHTNNAKFNSKLDKKPNGNTDLINEVTGKINQEYVPTGIAKGLIFAGTFNENGIISASAYAPETQGLNIKDINVSTIVGYEFQYIGEKEYTLGTLKVNKNDIIVCNGAEEPNWTLIDNSDKVVSVNGQTGAVIIDFQEIEQDSKKILLLGVNGTIGEKANFVVEDAESYIPYRNNLTEFVVSAIIPVTGEVDLTKEVTIDFGDTSYYLFDALDITRRLTLGDLNFALKESLVTGYNYLFRTVFFNNAETVGFAVLPAKDEVLSLTSDQMDNYMADGGLPNGQLAICKKVVVNGYTEGAVYRFKITYPNTYEWEEISGSVKIDKSSIVKNESGELEAVALKNKVLYKENNNIVEANFNGYVELTDSEYETLESTGSVVLSDGRTLTFDKGTIYVTPLADAISKLIFEKTGSVLKSKQSFDTHVQIMIEFETQGMHYGADFILHPYDAAICMVSYNFVGHTGTAYLDEYGYVNVNIPDNLSFTDIKGHYMELGG